MQTYKFNTLIATLVAAAAFLLLMAHDSMAAPIYVMYGGVGNKPTARAGELLVIDQNNASGTLIGDPITPGGLSGIAFNANGALLGSTVFGSGSTSQLVQINPDTGALVSTIGDITVSGSPISIGDLAFQPGTDVLFGIRSATNNANVAGELYTIDTATGVATLVGNTGTQAGGGIAFAPGGTLYFTSRDPSDTNFFGLNTLNPNTASVLNTKRLLNFYDGLGIRPSDGILFAAGPNVGDISIVNPVTGAETLLGNTGSGHPGDLDFRVIPEPGSLILLALGLLCIIVYGWRCRKRAAEGHASP